MSKWLDDLPNDDLTDQ